MRGGTHDQTLQFAKEAENLKSSGAINSAVKGVKGMTWSMFLPGLDVITGVTIEYMQLCFAWHYQDAINTMDRQSLFSSAMASWVGQK